MNVFEYRALTEQDKYNLGNLQGGFIEMERIIMANVPEGRERALAITKLQECRMWANAGVVLVRPTE